MTFDAASLLTSDLCFIMFIEMKCRSKEEAFRIEHEICDAVTAMNDIVHLGYGHYFYISLHLQKEE